ncbi:MAG: hypothetical protein N2595_03110 [bacterium]|nr:hypothetical protein [bacterium]
MNRIAEYLTADQAAARLLHLATTLATNEVAAVPNLGVIPAPHDLYLLAPHTPLPVTSITAFAVDMDGTSTTTEPLALHALEYMLRRITGRINPDAWPGLDPVHDVPFVIGNSNFRHTEFLFTRYRSAIDPTAFRSSVMEAWLWTLLHMRDRQRLAEVRRHIHLCDAAAVLNDPELLSAFANPPAPPEITQLIARLVARYAHSVRPSHDSLAVAAALDVYYHRYHELLQRIERGEADALAQELLGAQRHLIAPMPGYAIFVALVKGWLSDAAARALAPVLRAAHPRSTAPAPHDLPTLLRLAQHFRSLPAKLALVTASIAYEAHVSMQEVLRVIRHEITTWPLPTAARDELSARFTNYHTVFDGFVTASDAWEARLKPHRDLYSIALYQMGVPSTAYSTCMAIEDTEPGIIAARAAGFGITIALPNRDTARQNYAKAARVLHAGLPELILDHSLMLTPSP